MATHYWLRTHAPRHTKHMSTANDREAGAAFDTIAEITPTDHELRPFLREIIQLPIDLKGCGIRSASQLKGIPYLASYESCTRHVMRIMRDTHCAHPPSQDSFGDTPVQSPVIGGVMDILPDSMQAEITTAWNDLPPNVSGLLCIHTMGADAPTDKLQSKMTHILESEAAERVHRVPHMCDRDKAKHYSTEGRWMFATPLPHMRIHDPNHTTLLRRYLGLPLHPCIRLGHAHDATIDKFDDFALSTTTRIAGQARAGAGATQGSDENASATAAHHTTAVHNAVAKAIRDFAKKARLAVSDNEPVHLLSTALNKRPADVHVAAPCSWSRAGNKDLWLDVSIINATAASNIPVPNSALGRRQHTTLQSRRPSTSRTSPRAGPTPTTTPRYSSATVTCRRRSSSSCSRGRTHGRRHTVATGRMPTCARSCGSPSWPLCWPGEWRPASTAQSIGSWRSAMRTRASTPAWPQCYSSRVDESISLRPRAQV